MTSSTIYPSDLTDAEWQYLEPLLPAAKATGRPRQWPLRLILNAIFYLVRSGCSWRMLPQEYPSWPTVHDYYRRWRRDGTWESIHTHIRQQVRLAVGRKATPSGAILDSQSVKTTEPGTLWVEALLDRTPSAMMASRRSKDASAIYWLISAQGAPGTGAQS
jgi:putative transposase